MWNACVHGWRQFRSDFSRYAIAFFSVAIGVGLLFGTLITAAGVNERVADGVQSLGGIGDLAVTPSLSGGTISADQSAMIAELPGVASTVPMLLHDSAVRSAQAGLVENLTVTGYPAEWNQTLGELRIDGRLPSSGEFEIAIPEEVAQRLKASVGDTVTVAGAEAPQALVVVGVFDSERIGVLAVDAVFVDIATAQSIFNLEGRVSRVDVRLQANFSPSTWQEEVRERLPAGLIVQDPSSLTAAFTPLLSAISLILTLAALVALAVSALLVASSVSSVVEARRSSYGAMRAVGASGRWLAGTVLLEAGVIGLIGGVSGIALGFGVSWALRAVLESGGSIPASNPEVSVLYVIGAVGIGLVASLVGAAKGRLQVTRQTPLSAFTADRPARKRRMTVFLLVGAVFLTAGVLAAWGTGAPVKLLGTIAVISGASLLSVALLWAATSALGGRFWTMRVSARRIGQLRTLGPSTALTTAIVCLGTALIGGVSAINVAMQEQLTRQFGADLQVTAPTAMDDELTGILTRVPGVTLASGTTWGTAHILTDKQSEISFLAVDPASYPRTAQLPWVEGDDTESWKQLSAGNAVIVPASLAESRALEVGDQITLSSEGATVDLRIIATFASLSTGNQIVVSKQTASELGVSGLRSWNLGISAKDDATEVAKLVEEATADIPGITVATSSSIRERAIKELGTYTVAVFGVVLVALLSGATGTASAFALSIIRRRSELGILRAVGAQRRGIGAMVFAEAIYVGLASCVAGITAGLFGATLLTALIAEVLGVTLATTVNPLAILGVAALTIGTLIVAAMSASWRASHVEPIIALRTAAG